MSIMDAQLLFGEAIDLGSTSATSSVSGTNTVNVANYKDAITGSSTSDRINEGGRIMLNVTVEDEELLASSSSATLTMRLYNHSTVSVTSGSIILQKDVTVPAGTATQVDGTILWQQPLPHGALLDELGINFLVSTKKLLTGKVTAYLSLDGQST